MKLNGHQWRKKSRKFVPPQEPIWPDPDKLETLAEYMDNTDYGDDEPGDCNGDVPRDLRNWAWSVRRLRQDHEQQESRRAVVWLLWSLVWTAVGATGTMIVMSSM